jgi:hypothetical protein
VGTHGTLPVVGHLRVPAAVLSGVDALLESRPAGPALPATPPPAQLDTFDTFKTFDTLIR